MCSVRGYITFLTFEKEKKSEFFNENADIFFNARTCDYFKSYETLAFKSWNSDWKNKFMKINDGLSDEKTWDPGLDAIGWS